ncbi:MAG: type II CRISPR RNA-guided endonuclease Cas9, partial [Bacteroidaceae bacterium]|nr:type II CRISPR RNA-guided endonuclease Cas9 [Bacteroidaceae bacterium]
WTKRNDHRHHAMDAITIAFTKAAHIQYLNNLSAKSDKSSSIYGILQNETTKTADGKRIFCPPMPVNELRADCKAQLESILVSIKAKNKVVTRNVNVTKCKGGNKKKTMLTPRGPLHKEQVYGLRHQYETQMVTVGPQMTPDIIATVSSKMEREALLKRLAQCGGDPKKAFSGQNSLEKNPIYLDSAHTKTLSAKVKCTLFKKVFSIRKEIKELSVVDKVMDSKIRKILKSRIDAYGGNKAKAFSNLEDEPIWLDEAKGIKLKRVTIAENFNLLALHDKRDKNGKLVFDQNGNTIPSDFVNLNNNHHIAIYKDADGNLQESVVTFFEAMNRIISGFPIVDRNYRKSDGWEFQFSMKINEMFVFPNPKQDFFPEEIDLMDENNYAKISPNLYRVQTLSSGDYRFRHHLETMLIDDKKLQDITWKRLSIKWLNGVVKVRINHLGKIVSVGEYD